jgi:hypothetical protein
LSSLLDPEPSLAVLPNGVVLGGFRYTDIFARGLIADVMDSSLDLLGTHVFHGTEDQTLAGLPQSIPP